MGRERWAAGFWVALQLALQVSLFLGSPDGFTLDEGEMGQPTTSWLVLHGYIGRFPELQMGSYAGSAALTPFLAAPFLVVLGPKLVAWKAAIWTFSAALLLVGRRLAMELSGRAGAELFCALIVLAPTFYLGVSVHGLGSHTGVMLPVLLSALALLRVIETDDVRPAAALGLAMGLTITTAYTGAFAVPTLLVLWLAARRPTLPQLGAWAGSLAIGLLPWIGLTLTQFGHRTTLPEGQGLTEFLSLAHVLERIPLLVDGPYTDGMFVGTLPVGPGHWVASIQALGVLVAVGLAVRAIRTGRVAAARAWVPAALTLAYVLAFLITDPTADRSDLDPVITPNSLRYHAPLVPLAALCLGQALASLPSRWVLPLLVALLGPGLTARLAQLDAEYTRRPLHLPALELELTYSKMPRPSLTFVEVRQAGRTLEALYGRPLSDDRWMRRLHWELLGFELGSHVGAADFTDFAALGTWMRTLEPDVWPDLFRGMAANSERPSDQKLARFPPELVSLADRAWLRRDLEPCLGALQNGSWSGTSSCSGPQIIWAMGAAGELARDGAPVPFSDVPAEHQESFAEGMGDAHGQRWGYSDMACPLSGHCAAWTRGFEAGKAHVFGPE